MKRMMFFMLMILGILSACSDDDDNNASVGFGKDVYILNGDAPVEVVLNMSEAVSVPTSVSFTIAGTAVEDKDYTLSAHEFKFAAGESSAKITIEPKDNFTEGLTIKLTLQTIPGYSIRSTGSTIVTVVPQEVIIASFTTDETELASTRAIKVTFRGAINKDYTSSRDLHIPFTVGGTAVSGVHYEIEGNATEFVVPAGKKEASINLKFKNLEAGKDKIVLKLNEGVGIQMGNNQSVTIQITGPTSFADMIGKWEYNGEFPSWEWIESVVLEEYPGDETNAPTASSSSGVLEFISGEIDSMVVNMTGDMAHYLRNGRVSFIREVPDEELVETGTRVAVMYMELSSANVNFSATHTKIRPAVVEFRFLNPGKTQLQIRIIDYEPTDFLTQVWEEWKEESDIYDLPLREWFPLCFNFNKVQ